MVRSATGDDWHAVLVKGDEPARLMIEPIGTGNLGRRLLLLPQSPETHAARLVNGPVEAAHLAVVGRSMDALDARLNCALTEEPQRDRTNGGALPILGSGLPGSR